MKIILIFIAACWESSQGETTRDFAKLRVRRSTDNGFQVHVEHGLPENPNVELNLRPATYSIFAPSFQYMEASEDVTGSTQFEDSTPTKEELEMIQKHFFTDFEANAAVSLKTTVEGSYKMSGRISHDLSIVHKGGDHQVSKRAVSQDQRWSDYIDINRTIITGRSFSSNKITKARPEVFVVFDYENSKQFGHDREKILDYLGVFFHAVNNRFETAENPQISFRISGVVAVKSCSKQPFMEHNKVPGGYDIIGVIEDFGTWVYSNSGNIPKYDLAALISGKDMKAWDDKTQVYSSSVAGIAYLEGACLSDAKNEVYGGTSVSEDIGGYYNGVMTVAHELAHNLGAPHDGDREAAPCAWNDGHIMSYEGWGTKNKFYFSSCSLKLMKQFIDSPQGACTRSQQSSEDVSISGDYVGDRMDMTELCVQLTNREDAIPDPDTSPDDLCKELTCRYSIATGPWWVQHAIQSMRRPPGDYSPCVSLLRTTL